MPQWVCIALGACGALALVAATFRLNAKYGEHGLMKRMAKRRHPRFLINRRNPRRFFPHPKRKEVGYA